MKRGEIYRKILKIKGRYIFICGMDLDEGINFSIDDNHVFRKIINSILKGHTVILHFVFSFDLKRGYEINPFIKERVFVWIPEKGEFELVDEFYMCEGAEYDNIHDFDYGTVRCKYGN